ncbi:Hypothetical protein (Fragment) [Durusdinium trenchii]|uniref:Uncharacterized protein n=1 Tax=Durusdinium trenchii TaxID=1381693 RepID=A0ABP0SQ89_9DINO
MAQKAQEDEMQGGDAAEQGVGGESGGKVEPEQAVLVAHEEAEKGALQQVSQAGTEAANTGPAAPPGAEAVAQGEATAFQESDQPSQKVVQDHAAEPPAQVQAQVRSLEDDSGSKAIAEEGNNAKAAVAQRETPSSREPDQKSQIVVEDHAGEASPQGQAEVPEDIVVAARLKEDITAKDSLEAVAGQISDQTEVDKLRNTYLQSSEQLAKKKENERDANKEMVKRKQEARVLAKQEREAIAGEHVLVKELFDTYDGGLRFVYRRYCRSKHLGGSKKTFDDISAHGDMLDFDKVNRLCRDFGLVHKKGLSVPQCKAMFLRVAKQGNDFTRIGFEQFRDLLVLCAEELLTREPWVERYNSMSTRVRALFHRMDLADSHRADLTKRLVAFGGFRGGDGKLAGHIDVPIGTAHSPAFSRFNFEHFTQHVQADGARGHLVETLKKPGEPQTPPKVTQQRRRLQAKVTHNHHHNFHPVQESNLQHLHQQFPHQAAGSPVQLSLGRQGASNKSVLSKTGQTQRINSNGLKDQRDPAIPRSFQHAIKPQQRDERALQVRNQFHLDPEGEEELIGALGLFQGPAERCCGNNTSSISSSGAAQLVGHEHADPASMWDDFDALEVDYQIRAPPREKAAGGGGSWVPGMKQARVLRAKKATGSKAPQKGQKPRLHKPHPPRARNEKSLRSKRHVALSQRSAPAARKAVVAPRHAPVQKTVARGGRQSPQPPQRQHAVGRKTLRAQGARSPPPQARQAPPVQNAFLQQQPQTFAEIYQPYLQDPSFNAVQLAYTSPQPYVQAAPPQNAFDYSFTM